MNDAKHHGSKMPRPVLWTLDPHPCAYLHDRTAREAVCVLPVRTGRAYEFLLQRGFRRAGRIFYRPACLDCRACVPLRVPVGRFRPSRSQRRVWRRNRDVRVTLRRPACDAQRFALFCRHQDAQFGRRMCATPDELREAVFESPIETLEMDYWLSERLVGVGVVDVCPQSISSVYFFFDPACRRRSLGTLSVLVEIDLARQWGRQWWYAGYWIRECRSMAYKAAFGPHEVLTRRGWREVDRTHAE